MFIITKNLKEIRCDGKYTDKIILAKGNKVETIIWRNSKFKDFNVVNVQICLEKQNTHIKTFQKIKENKNE